MFEIKTRYGNKYIINEKGQVLNYGDLDKTNSSEAELNTWIITGVWKHKGFGHIIEIPLKDIIVNDQITINDFTLKNSYPRYGLTDIDHGTSRVHGNKQAHGIRYIRKLN